MDHLTLYRVTISYETTTGPRDFSRSFTTGNSDRSPRGSTTVLLARHASVHGDQLTLQMPAGGKATIDRSGCRYD